MEMELDKKKILALIGLVVVSVGLGYLIYVLFFKSDVPDGAGPDGTVATGKLNRSSEAESDGEGGEDEFVTEGELPDSEPALIQSGETKVITVASVITDPSMGVTLSGDGKTLQYYDQLTGKFYRIDENGNKILLSNETFPAVKNVTWAPNKTSAVINFPDGNKVIYDFATEKQHSIPGHWDNIAFSPDSAQIQGITKSPDPGQRFLFIARPDGTGAHPIEELGNNSDKVIPSWSPNDQVVAFSRTGAALSGGADRQAILMIGKNHENFRQITVEGLGFEHIWSPQGDRILYSAYNGASGLIPTLWVDGGTNDSVGAAKNYIGLNTWAHKCAFLDDHEVLCAVPNPDKLPPGIGFAPDLATDTDDTIYKVNIKTGLQTIVGKPDGNRTIEHMTVSKDGRFLFMKDQTNGEVIKMPLK